MKQVKCPTAEICIFSKWLGINMQKLNKMKKMNGTYHIEARIRSRKERMVSKLWWKHRSRRRGTENVGDGRRCAETKTGKSCSHGFYAREMATGNQTGREKGS